MSEIKKKPSLRKSALTTGLMTGISRISGLLRDVCFSQFFGASANMDSFFVAFKIPNLLRRFFAEGAFSQSFVPIINEYKELHPEKVRDLVGSTFGSLSLILFFITALGVVIAPILVYLFAPGFSGNDGQLLITTQMLRYCFPYILFISLTSLLGSLLNSYGNFLVPAITPVILNLCLIIGAIYLSSWFHPPELGLAVAVFFAGLFQLIFQLPFVIRKKLTFRPRINFSYPGVRKIYKLMLPGIFGSSVAQINILIDTLLASFLVTGSISWLYYSDRLMEFPLGVFGIAVATVILPKLSSDNASDNTEEFKKSFTWGINAVITIGLPSTMGIILIGDHLLYAFFFSANFNLHDVSMAYASLVAYSIGLLAFMLIKILVTGYYSRQDTKTPVRFALYSLFLNISLNLFFIFILYRFVGEALHAGLALATSCAALFNVYLLYRELIRIRAIDSGVIFNVHNAKKVLATMIMSASIVISKSYFIPNPYFMERLSVIFNLSLIILIACLVYGVIWHLFIHQDSSLQARD